MTGAAEKVNLLGMPKAKLEAFFLKPWGGKSVSVPSRFSSGCISAVLMTSIK